MASSLSSKPEPNRIERVVSKPKGVIWSQALSKLSLGPDRNNRSGSASDVADGCRNQAASMPV